METFKRHKSEFIWSHNMSIEVNSKVIGTDQEGYLVKAEDWIDKEA
jgi:hypothetical protein